MTNERDDELDRLLEPLREQQPSAGQIKSWQLAVRQSRAHVKRLASSRWVQLAAAAAVGFVAGGMLFKQPSAPVIQSQNMVDATVSDDDATVVYLVAKSE